MKMLVAGLVGSGAGAVVLLAYLSLSQQQETKKDIAVDKATIEVQRARFDKDFEEKWQSFDGKRPSNSTLAKHDARIDAAQRELATARKQQDAAVMHSEKDLAELKAAIDAMDKSATPSNPPSPTLTK